MDADPGDWVAAGGTFVDEEQLVRVGGDQGVAVHAGRGGWNGGVSGRLDRVVAVAAVDPQFAGVLGKDGKERPLGGVRSGWGRGGKGGATRGAAGP